jgi:hypothetical protein
LLTVLEVSAYGRLVSCFRDFGEAVYHGERARQSREANIIAGRKHRE